MFWTRLTVSVTEFVLSVFLAVFVVFWSYQSFAKMMDYDVEAELRNGNTAVAVLLSALMTATSFMMHETVYPVMSIITLWLTGGASLGLLHLIGYCGGHLLLGFLVAVGTIKLSLRAFETLATGIDEETEIRKGNTAVAVVMAGVVLVIALYLQQGVGGLTKTLIPQPSLGEVDVLR